MLLFCSANLRPPNLLGLQFIKWWVVKRHVDAGFEGFVNRSHTVGGKEQDPLVIFEYTKEHFTLC